MSSKRRVRKAPNSDADTLSVGSESGSTSAAAMAAPAAPTAAASTPCETSHLYKSADVPLLSTYDAVTRQLFAQLEDLAAGYAGTGWHFVCEQEGVTVTRTDDAVEPGFTCSKGTQHATCCTSVVH